MKLSSFLPSSLSKTLTPWHYVSATALVALTVFSSQSASAVMLDLGTLSAEAISGDGTTVVGIIGTAELFYWRAGTGVVSLGSLTDLTFNSVVNRDGTYIAGSAAIIPGDPLNHAFRWDAVNGFVDLGALNGPWSQISGISNDGRVVVATDLDSAGHDQFFRWEAGTVKYVSNARAQAVSGDGNVVVGRSADLAFRWDEASGIVSLGALPNGVFSTANATNRDGSVIVGISDLGGPAQHAFRHTAAGMQDLGTLGGGWSSAIDVNADGSVVVGTSEVADGSDRAYRWTLGAGMVDLGVLTGQRESMASGVSDDGNIVVGDSGDRAFIWSTASPAIQDLSYLQASLLRSAITVDHLVSAQTRRLRDLAQQQCVPGALQTFCLSLGGNRYRGEGDTNGIQDHLNVAAGLRVNEYVAVGATAIVGRADLREQSAEQRKAFGLSVWGAYQQNADATGWNASASAAAGESDNQFERGTGLDDVQRARAKVDINSSVLRLAAQYGVPVGNSMISPEVALSHGKTTQNGFTERHVAFPLTIDSAQRRETYVTLAVRSATELSANGTLHLSVAADTLVKDNTPPITGHSTVPGLRGFKLDSNLDKRRVIPVANLGYSHALDAHSTLGGGVQLSQSRYAGERPLFGLGVQYRYSF